MKFTFNLKIYLILLLVVTKGLSQDQFIDLYKANLNFTSQLTLTVTAGDYTQDLSGKTTVNETFQYVQIGSGEFYTYDRVQVKVSNTEKKVAYYPIEFMQEIQSFKFDKEFLEAFYYLKNPDVIESGYQFELIPLDNYRSLLGQTTIRTDKDFKINQITYTFPTPNPYGVSKMIYNFTNRVEKTDLTKDPTLYFKKTTNEFILLKKYSSYELINLPNEE